MKKLLFILGLLFLAPGYLSSSSFNNGSSGSTTILDTTTFNSNLSAADDTTQKAMDTIDDMAGGGGIAAVVDDLTPQLGGDLDVNGSEIVSVTNQNISITADGTGEVVLNELVVTGTCTGCGATTDGRSSGLLDGGVLSIGAPTSTFSITDGTGQIVDYWTSPGTTTITDVSWTGLTNQTVTNIGTQLITFVAINSAGSIIQQAGAFTNIQRRENIVLGVLVHVDNLVVDAVNNEQQFVLNPHNQLYDMSEALGFFNISGNVYSDNGANLNVDKSVGDMWKAGSNYGTDIQNPHVRTLAALTGLTFQYRFSDGTNGVTGIAIDPANLDDGAGGLTALSTNNKWSIQRFYSFTSNNVKVQRGVTEFDSQDAAIAGLGTEPFITEPSIAANGLLRGFLIARKNATDLSDPAQAVFLESDKFGGTGGASGAGSTSPLTTKGDLFGFGTGNARIPVGTDGQVIKALASDAEGMTWQDDIKELNIVIDGGGVAITTGVKGTVRIPYGVTVTGWHVVSDQSGSIVVDVNSIAFGSWVGGTGGTSIAGSELPTISAALTGSDTTITTWTDPIAADTMLTFEVDSAATVERVTVSITMTRN